MANLGVQSSASIKPLCWLALVSFVLHLLMNVSFYYRAPQASLFLVAPCTVVFS